MRDSYDGSSPVAWREIPGNNKLVYSAFHANQPITATITYYGTAIRSKFMALYPLYCTYTWWLGAIMDIL